MVKYKKGDYVELLTNYTLSFSYDGALKGKIGRVVDWSGGYIKLKIDNYFGWVDPQFIKKPFIKNTKLARKVYPKSVVDGDKLNLREF